MKLLIEIPEHIYEHAKELSEDSRDEGEAMRAIANGSRQESSSEIPNTCGDAISRQAVLDLAEWFDLNQQHFTVANLIDEVENMPSVTPQQRTDAEVLDKIRAEIDQYLFQNEFGSAYRKEVSQIIDKYKKKVRIRNERNCKNNRQNSSRVS